jgi:NhaA family Na+:H+ antiporter
MRLGRLARRPLDRFLGIQAASGIVLLLTAAIALVWANSPWAEHYVALWQTEVSVGLGGFVFRRTLEWVINDALMVVFFFVVGLEIRREMHHGELSEWRRAALPAAAAVGGMVAPAALYLLVAGAPATRSGWGVPMATDIAFAVGVLTVLGTRVPPALRVLLLALAVIDDLGAIVVIAVFYSSGVSVVGFGVALAGVGAVLAMQRAGIRNKLAYVPPGVVVWAGIYAAGVHPTIAGVIIGLLTPVRAWLGPDGFIVGVKAELDELQRVPVSDRGTHELAARLRQVDLARREALSPAESLIETLHPWVAFAIMPVFALANAGVTLTGGALAVVDVSVVVAVVVGLVIGKPVGILLAIFFTVKAKIGTLPTGLTLRHLVVLGVVGGVGFTMSIFVAGLAFTAPALLASAKLGVLVASAVAGVVALVLGRALLATSTVGARSADEAESSTEH